MKHIHTFDKFITEAQRHTPVDHIENIEVKDKSNKKVEKEIQDYIGDNIEICPRCGERMEDCQCESNDPWSTQNYHRVPKGKIEKSKAKQKQTTTRTLHTASTPIASRTLVFPWPLRPISVVTPGSRSSSSSGQERKSRSLR